MKIDNQITREFLRIFIMKNLWKNVLSFIFYFAMSWFVIIILPFYSNFCLNNFNLFFALFLCSLYISLFIGISISTCYVLYFFRLIGGNGF